MILIISIVFGNTDNCYITRASPDLVQHLAVHVHVVNDFERGAVQVHPRVWPRGADAGPCDLVLDHGPDCGVADLEARESR